MTATVGLVYRPRVGPRVAHDQEKQAIRERIWDQLEEEGIARFPFPPHGRIPNFKGARAAAEHLVEHPVVEDADNAKVNPDAPQKPVRELLLRQGTDVYVPTPRLTGGFKRLDPSEIPGNQLEEASALSKMDRYAEPVPLDRLPQMDVIVAGSVAVSRRGERVGKGEGYSDIEYAILLELGHDPVPVASTVHPIQVLEELPRDPYDLPLALVATPEETFEVQDPAPGPTGIDWELLGEERLEEMPVLRELKDRDAGT